MDESARRLLEQRFHDAMLEIYDVAGKETGYWAHYFLRAVKANGGLEEARRLLQVPGFSAGFERLKSEHALNLSVEAVVLRHEFAVLFSEDELARARSRLNTYGYAVSELAAECPQVQPGLE